MNEGIVRTRRFTVGAVSMLTVMIIQRGSAESFQLPNVCAQDDFCTLISVAHEIEKKIPSARAGAVIGVIDDDGFQSSSNDTQIEKKVCRKEVRVPRVVHRAVLKMFESVAQRGSVNALPAQLTASEQTMLLYYNTIMQQTMNSSCEK